MSQSRGRDDGGRLGLRILVVEDDALLSLMLEDALATLGCEVAAATTVNEGLHLAGTADIQIAVLDVNVAGHPVYPVAEVLRRRGIPFVFVTAYVHDGIDKTYDQVPWLHKPFHLADLEALLRTTAGAVVPTPPAA